MTRSISTPMGGITVRTSDISSRAYHLPSTLAEYRPDPAQPIDRWHQRADSGNARTTRRIIKDLVGGPSAVIDPFCGAGSTAVAAREMGVPFLGVDIDPLLVCVATAKARCDRRHLPLLDELGHVEDISAVEPSASGSDSPLGPAEPDDTFLSGCLALTLAAATPTTPAGTRRWIVQDAASGPSPAEVSDVRWGDAGTPGAWTGLEWLRPGWVVYGSPPFSLTRPSLSGRSSLRGAAAGLLRASGRAPQRQSPPSPGGRAHSASSEPVRSTDGIEAAPYTAIVLRMLCRLRPLAPGLVILEHEPSHQGGEDALSVARRVELDGMAAGVEVLRTRRFSAPGLFSLIVCELR